MINLRRLYVFIFLAFLTPFTVGSQTTNPQNVGSYAGDEEDESEGSFQYKGRQPQSLQNCLVDEDALKDLNQKRAKIRDQEIKLRELEKEIKTKEEFIQSEITRLEELRKSIAGLEATAGSKQEERVAKVVSTLQEMSPKAAASILATLEDRLAVEAMTRMDTVKLAKIMGKIQADRSAQLTEMLAGRNKMNRSLSSQNNQNEVDKKGEK